MEHAVALHHDHLVLGRFRPLRPLGSGGSGSVWLVRDERSARDVALKVVPREGKAGSRAEREVEAATRLRHPRCLRALALERDDHHVYVAYEYVPGKTLRQCIRSGELDDAASVEVGAQVLDALAHAHAKKVLHRDVKPGNVMVEDREELSVRLLDFGLAQLEEVETLTAAGDVPGTLAYISPERLAGDPAGAATDVWSTGVLLWEALAGRHPFGQGPFLELAKRIGRGAPSLGSARPDLPKPLVRLVDSALAIDPARRPTAAKLAVALRRAPTRRARPAVVPPRLRVSSLPTVPPVVPKLAPALLAALFAGWVTSTLAFFPASWPIGLAALAAVLTFRTPRLGLVFALAVPILPLGNISFGLALVYSAAAAAWVVLFWPRPRAALLFVAGPLLAPLGLLTLLPLVVLPAGDAARRAAQAAGAVVAAAVVAALAGHPLPIVGGAAPDLALAGVGGPFGAAGQLVHGIGGSGGLVAETLVLAAAAASVGAFRHRGPWGGALFGALVAASTLLADPGASALPLVAGAWLCGVALALEPIRPRRPSRMAARARSMLQLRPRLRPVHGS